MPTIQTRVGRVAYAELGSGPTVLLLHATLHDRHDFDPIAETLARRYRTIAVDWPGHGDSDAIPAGIEPGAVRVVGWWGGAGPRLTARWPSSSRGGRARGRGRGS